MICYPCFYQTISPRRRVQVSDIERAAYDAVMQFIDPYRERRRRAEIALTGPEIMYRRLSVRPVVFMRAMVFHYLHFRQGVSMAKACNTYNVDRTTAIHGREIVNNILSQKHSDNYKDAVEWFYKQLND